MDEDRNNFEAKLKIFNEKANGFPWLAEEFANYEYLQDLKEVEYLERKSHPALTTAERLKRKNQEKKIINKKLRIAQGLIKYYKTLFPILDDFTGDVDDDVLIKVLSVNITEPIESVQDIQGVDPVEIFLSNITREEFNMLSTTERNQLALDRYWNRRKSDWEIGRDYERYVGYLYEKQGYNVTYHGIIKGYEDLGRDLICKKGERTLVIQCKYWSKQKVIREKHIMQLYGSTIQYMLEYPKEIVDGIFYTTTSLSNTARDFAKYLHIKLYENHDFESNYACIKCNISRRTGEAIYHLPFDQQYDNVIIEPEKGEFYAKTVEEAESQGFRRAWRWHGESEG